MEMKTIQSALKVGDEFRYIGANWYSAKNHNFRVVRHVNDGFENYIIAIGLDSDFTGHSAYNPRDGYCDMTEKSWCFYDEDVDDIVALPLPKRDNSQESLVLNHLLKGGAITRISADHLYRVASLTKVVSRLRQRGYKIRSNRKYDLTGRPYQEYSLPNTRKVA